MPKRENGLGNVPFQKRPQPMVSTRGVMSCALEDAKAFPPTRRMRVL